jgi:hypothetical protein
VGLVVEIPLERTIGDTYKFTFSNILSIFGIAWLPMLIMVVAIGAMIWAIFPDLQSVDWSANADVTHNQAVFAHAGFKIALAIFPLEILFYLLFAMIMVGIQRKALGLREGPVFVYFSLGGAVWRMLGAMIATVILIVVGGGLAGAAVALVFWAGTQFNLPSIYGLVEFIAIVAAVCWFFYMTVRLMFFVPTVVVAEGGFGIVRSWELGGGNFWRIVVVLLACGLAPAMVISMVSNIVLMPFMMVPMMHFQEAVNAHQVIPPQEMFSMFAQSFRQMLPFFIVYEVITFPILIGLQTSMSAFAYRNITRSEVAA